MTRLFNYGSCLLVVVLGIAGCTSDEGSETQAPATMEQATEGFAVSVALDGKSGRDQVQGTVTFEPATEGVRVMADISGLKAGSVHGFHIHEKGDCSAPDATSAGGHFNPGDTDHGAPDAKESHAGDLGNIESDEEGHGKLNKVFQGISLDSEAKNSILGKAVVVHAGEDDLTSQPSGAAGPRIACGVIEKPEAAAAGSSSQ